MRSVGQPMLSARAGFRLISFRSQQTNSLAAGALQKTMMKFAQKVACAALLLVSVSAVSAASPWSVRLRATYLETVDESDAFSALGINFGKDAISVNDKLIPEIDVNYAFTDTLGAELVLTIPQTQDVSLAGVGKLGSFKHLPPTLLFQYRANPGGSIRPYVGLGGNFTLIWNTNLSVAGVPLHLDNYSLGFAAQAGIDWKIDSKWSFNLDIKRAGIHSDVSTSAARLTETRLNPWLYAIGLRYEF
jgi:outer membrane protein